MRALRFGLAIALSATVAVGVYTNYPGNDAFTQALKRTALLARNFDPHLSSSLRTMIASAEIGPDGEVFFNRALGERFVKPNSGHYWQISGEGQEDFRSRSLWDRRLRLSGCKARTEPLYYTSEQFSNEPLRIVERTVRLPGSDTEWQFAVAQSFD